jgi:hypothetical protein
VEKAVRAQAALTGPCEDNLPALQHCAAQGKSRPHQAPQLLLQTPPEALRLSRRRATLVHESMHKLQNSPVWLFTRKFQSCLLLMTGSHTTIV